MKRILDGMQKTMMAVKPPRYTALEGLQKAETANPFKILIGTVLSARTRDENTTKAVTELFKVYNTPQKLAKAKAKNIEKMIKSVGFYHVKSKRIIEVANIILTKYHGKVPADIDKLVEIPGVGRKTLKSSVTALVVFSSLVLAESTVPINILKGLAVSA